MIRFGIAGFGLHAAQNLVPGFRLAKKCKLTALSRRHLDAARASASQYRVPLAFDSLADLARSPDVDAVIVATPNVCHHRDVLSALESGKPVLCEKPMGMNADECREMIEAAARRHLTLGVAHVFRFDDNAQSFREKLQSGSVGRPLFARAEFLYRAADSARGWIADPQIAGGGSIADVGVHCIDTLRFVLDDEVARVFASATGGQKSGGVETTAILNLEFCRGTVATVLVSMDAGYRMVLEVVGRAGKLLAVDDPASSETSPRAGFKRYLPYARQLDAFADALEQNVAFLVSGEEGLRNQLVLDAAYRSIRTQLAESPAAT